jgi:beta-1,4-mannosyl-glycoprotein beta-1,4-N-acetylglucosaminyltransferase
MKIFDCFMYFDEEIVLDLRLNTLNDHVDYFVIVESCFTHKGDKRKLKFNYEKFSKFKDKIIYLIYDQEPKNIETVNESDDVNEKTRKYILNAAYRENGQRNFIVSGLDKAEKDDLILVSDVDEIPNLENLDLKNIKEKLLIFNQDMFYYKFNLKLPNLIWSGTKACRKKDLINPQWLRNVKDKKYSFYRLDVMFSKTKYNDIKFVNNGGWHFSNIKNALEIELKLRSYLHHREFDTNPMTPEEIEKIIKNKQAIYDLKVDKRVNKIGDGSKLENYPLNKLPIFLQNNLENYKEWIDYN